METFYNNYYRRSCAMFVEKVQLKIEMQKPI